MGYPLDDGQAEIARRWLATPVDERRPVVPRPAATVMLVRDGDAGIECYLQRRPVTMRFAAGMMAFPGGAAEAHDGGDLAVTAIRETIEETGVLLADPVGLGARPDEVEAARRRVELGAPLADAVGALRVRLRADLLSWWMRWVTPEFSPRRYDTTFFAAVVRPHDDPRPLTGESEWGGWFDCAGALDRELPLMQVTRQALVSIAAHPTVAELAAAAPGRDRRPVLAHLVEGADPPEVTNSPLPDPV